jgi:uncharacterized membrane protein YfcA
MPSSVVVCCVIFVAIASLLRGLTGFGFAIVAAPLLAIVVSPLVAVSLVTLLQIPSGLPAVVRNWADTDFRAASTSWLAGIPTLLPGLYLVSRVPPEPMRIVLGVIVVLSSIFLSLGVNIGRPPRTGELIGVGELLGYRLPALPIFLIARYKFWVLDPQDDGGITTFAKHGILLLPSCNGRQKQLFKFLKAAEWHL